jgi:hypothetical protein
LLHFFRHDYLTFPLSIDISNKRGKLKVEGIYLMGGMDDEKITSGQGSFSDSDNLDVGWLLLEFGRKQRTVRAMRAMCAVRSVPSMHLWRPGS